LQVEKQNLLLPPACSSEEIVYTRTLMVEVIDPLQRPTFDERLLAMPPLATARAVELGSNSPPPSGNDARDASTGALPAHLREPSGRANRPNRICASATESLLSRIEGGMQ
jgi:hypothetical protein